MTEPHEGDSALSATLAQQFPAVPLQSVVRCVWDAASAVEFAGVGAEERPGLVERLARAHLEELVPFYDEDAALPD